MRRVLVQTAPISRRLTAVTPFRTNRQSFKLFPTESIQHRPIRAPKNLSHTPPPPPIQQLSPPQIRGTEASRRAVLTALAGNAVNATSKFVAFFFTGSGTMLSEALHSLADVGNQSLLFIGIKHSARPPTNEHPYGFDGVRFVYALLSATGMFFLGACFSLGHGVYHIMHPGELSDLWIALTLLGLSMCIESFTFTRGVLAVRVSAQESGMTFMEYLRAGPDPMGVAVVMEDGAGLVGVATAASCLALSVWTGNPIYDAIGSCLIAMLLGCIAVFLILKNARALVGRTAAPTKRQAIINVLQQDPMVTSVHNVKAMQLGADAISLNADIEFDGPALAAKCVGTQPALVAALQRTQNQGEVEALLVQFGSYVVSSLGDEVDRIEADLKRKVPDVKYVDLESN